MKLAEKSVGAATACRGALMAGDDVSTTLAVAIASTVAAKHNLVTSKCYTAPQATVEHSSSAQMIYPLWTAIDRWIVLDAVGFRIRLVRLRGIYMRLFGKIMHLVLSLANRLYRTK